MSLNLLAVALIVPPLNLVPVSIAGLVLVSRFRRTGLTLLTIGLGGLLALSLPAVANRLLMSVEANLPMTPPPGDPPQAIVVLTAEMAHSIEPPLMDVGGVGLERTRAAAILYRRVKLPVLVTGGIIEPGDVDLAGVMASSLETDFATPVRWIEAKSLDTRENARFSAEILRKAGIHSVYVVTHAWHMKRAVIAFHEAGITVTAAPVRLDRAGSGTYLDFIPTITGWADSFTALHEWIGLVYYALIR